MSYVIEFTDQALADIEKLKRSGNVALSKKVRIPISLVEVFSFSEQE